MKNFPLIFSLFFILAVAGFYSCEEDDADTQEPVIQLMAPEDGTVLYAGGDIHFEVEFEDDTELRSYKVDIHSNFDGHTHKGTLTAGEGHPWSYQQSWDFEPGKKNTHVHHHEIVVPETIEGEPIATGDYHFMVYCTDAAGNESWVAKAIEIQQPTDTEAPVFSNINAPATDAVFGPDETITISGTVSDNDHLAGLFIAIMPEDATHEEANPEGALAVLYHSHEDVHEKSTYDFSASITVGQEQDNNPEPKTIDWASGNYYLLIKSPDESGNVGFSEHYPIQLSL